jgi:hypothetical protein
MFGKGRAAVAALGVLAFASAPARAEEGMWTFDNFPTARVREDLGWAPDRAWLDRVMAGSARLPGCSASNVSAHGLILTNHHCVVVCVQNLSSAQANYLADGFMARAREEERRCPGMDVQVLTAIADVTQRIDTATRDVTPEAFAGVRNAEIARIEGECSSGMQRCEVVTLYQGGRYALYTYRRYDDVRLVFAPEAEMAHFGGDIDNFNFPRYCTDFAFLRLYENGAPAATPRHLSMRFTPLTDGEITLVAGNPGATSRLRTTAELAFERDVNLPWRLQTLSEARAQLAAYATQGPDQTRAASSALQSVENSLKALTGRHAALVDPQGFARVAERERDLQQRVARNRAAQREVGRAWDEVAAAQRVYQRIFYPYQYLEARAGERSILFSWARDIVRGAAERQKPDSERLPRYTEARIATVAQSIAAQRPVAASFEELNLAFWLSKARQYAPASYPALQRAFGQEAPETLAHRLAQSRLADPAYRQQLWDGGAAAVEASDDPLIVFVRAWDADARAARTQFDEQVEGPVARAQERIARVRFRAFGETQYPDATFSPRLSYGRVAGWVENGNAVASFTHIAGLYERATGQAPFMLTPRWIEARARLNGDVIFNVSSTHDVIGGNSGSPLLDRQGRVVGAVFDGNIHSLGGEYFYDGERNRTVTVAATLIRTSLADVYGMDALLAELEGR